jgi:predicted nucleic acid-binding protein
MILLPDNEYAVVLDACVLVPMPLCDTLLRLAQNPSMYRALWSEEILAEVAKAIQFSLGYTADQADRRIRTMREAFPEAIIPAPASLDKAFDCIPDPKDRHVLSVAVSGHVHAIVTNNVKHFPEDCLKQFGILRHTADDFLIHQYWINPDSILDVLDRQSQARRRSREDLLVGLIPEAPEFVKLIKQEHG